MGLITESSNIFFLLSYFCSAENNLTDKTPTPVINAENASLKAKKLALMAKRTREQLLTSSCESLCTTTTMAPAQKKSANPGNVF